MASISVGLKPRWEVEFLLAHQKFSFGLHSKRISLRLHLHTGFLLFFALRIARARGTILRRPAPNWVRFVFQLRHSQRGALGRLGTLKTLPVDCGAGHRGPRRSRR
jgi:hypothetical protein